MCVSRGAPKKPEYGPCQERHQGSNSWIYSGYGFADDSGTTSAGNSTDLYANYWIDATSTATMTFTIS